MRIATTWMLEGVEDSLGRPYGGIGSETRRRIDPEGMHVLTQALRGEDGYLRIIALLKILGHDTPVQTILEMSGGDYRGLPDERTVIAALEEKARAEGKSGGGV